jgi:hypothetical protein
MTRPLYAQYPLKRRLGGSKSGSGCFGEEKNLLFLLGIKPRIVQQVV